jgi:S1-C subfamily serine protease
VNGRAVATVGDETAIVRSLQPGEEVVVDLRRGKQVLEARVRLGATDG